MLLELKRYHRLWPALLLSLALGAPLHAESVPTAQLDPALARGFAPEQLFQGYAELDNVNAFNGNLVIPIPLGQEYSVGGDLAYQLTLTYNSQVWDIDTVVNALGSWNKARPARLSNAGVGWTLTLGQFFHPDDPANDADPATGRPSASRDSAGVTTTMQFDALGRLTEVTPAEEATTSYSHSVPSTAVDCRNAANQAQVTIRPASAARR